MNDFDYLGEKTVYLDAACQSLRPRPVVETLEKYYFEHNSCGERVKYPWGEKTDELVEGARKKVLKLLKLKSKDYFVSFTLNTTYGINLILNELGQTTVKQVITSDIEHNSPFLATMAMSERLGIPRIVLKRNDDGSLPLSGKLSEVARGDYGDEELDFTESLVVVNCAANFDGRRLTNLHELVKKVHKAGGLVVIDAAQAMAHYYEMLEKTEADAICFSAHKMYAPSLGVIVARRDLVPKLKQNFIGGGMVDDVFQDRYLLSAEGNKDHIHTIFEAGLQAWGEICALGAAIDWLEDRSKADKKRLVDYAKELDEFLCAHEKVHMVGSEANPTMSFYVEGLDSHLLGAALGKEGIMARTGYFCAHYYLDKVCQYPPLVRFSLSYATRESDIERVKKALRKL
ncbi:MAG: aminotransferase class V-fold PLP-dependent enzyme [Lactobacillus sp.]|nr:aminotransferase class V-fold PLP-dependent enzyme [Lactobacillus sp.]